MKTCVNIFENNKNPTLNFFFFFPFGGRGETKNHAFKNLEVARKSLVKWVVC
jgi:hypothetical protein